MQLGGQFFTCDYVDAASKRQNVVSIVESCKEHEINCNGQNDTGCFSVCFSLFHDSNWGMVLLFHGYLNILLSLFVSASDAAYWGTLFIVLCYFKILVCHTGLLFSHISNIWIYVISHVCLASYLFVCLGFFLFLFLFVCLCVVFLRHIF